MANLTPQLRVRDGQQTMAPAWLGRETEHQETSAAWRL